MTGIGTYWRTVRHLRREQIVGRLRVRLQRPKPDLGAAPAQRALEGRWTAPARRRASLIAPMRMRLLNVEADIDRCGWDDPALARLWRYNLHYFDDLNAQDAAGRAGMQRAFVTRWIESNPPAGGTGWEPYPVSLRIVNWIKWFLGGAAPEPAWLHSLAVQARWLRRRLEYHLLGNHLFANAKALTYAGAFFAGAEADEWLRTGTRILAGELREQVLGDGGQFERSPMYHALAFEDVLDLLNVCAAYGHAAHACEPAQAALRERAPAMLYWLRCMSHPDGSLGLFNDAADGVAPSLSELERYAADLGVSAPPPPQGIAHLRDSGYVRVAQDGALALLDVAPVGPDYLPGHAHADTLSFELSLDGQRVIVNGGTSCYGEGSRRQHERSTAAHSTVQIDGRDSSEVWSGFRVGRRARPFDLQLSPDRVCCSHDGYRFLPGRPVHRRCWRFAPCEMIVEDRVSTALPALARYLLAPGLALRERAPSQWLVLRSDAVIAQVEILAGQARIDSASHAPEFGRCVPVQCLAVTLIDGRAGTRWSWTEHAHPVSD